MTNQTTAAQETSPEVDSQTEQANVQPTFMLVASHYGYDDYDIRGCVLHQAKVSHRIKVNDIFNVYGPGPTKRGATWLGTIEASVRAFLEEITEVLPGATASEIREVVMQDIVGDYEVPNEVPEWAWVESNACFAHAQNGTNGIWEFILNLSSPFKDVPATLAPVIAEAQAEGIVYLGSPQKTEKIVR